MPTTPPRHRLPAAIILAASLAGQPARASETDQLTQRHTSLAALPDSLATLDGWMNTRLDLAAQRLDQAPVYTDPLAFVSDQFMGPISKQLMSHLELWIEAHPDMVPRFSPPFGHSIYEGTDLLDARFTKIIGMAPTVKVDGVLLGTDKLGHFLSQGATYAKQARTMPEAERWHRLQALGHEWESGTLGLTLDGVYSPADLAANWAGYRFWRVLVDGDDPYLAKVDGHWRRVRVFSFADFVSDDWDEALNPPYAIDQSMADQVQANIRVRCQASGQRPPTGTGRHEPEPYRSGEPVLAVQLHTDCGTSP